jgi:hypothetical protein
MLGLNENYYTPGSIIGLKESYYTPGKLLQTWKTITTHLVE